MAIKVRTNGQWLPVSGGGGEPVGTILMWAGASSNIPQGYLLCDGSAVSRSFYSSLFTAIGTTNGSGDGSSTFNIPDLRDKFVVGATAGSGDTTYPGVSPAATGGSATVVAQHAHTLPKIALNPGNDSTTSITLGSGQSYQIGYHQSSMSSRTTGDPTAVAANGNLPPYYALCYLIKVFNTRATAINSTPGPTGPPGPPGPASTVAGPPGPPGSGFTNIAQGQQSFTSNAQYTPTAGTKHITVHVIGGGGGGGSGNELTGEESNDHRPFGGGGGAGYCIGHYNITGQFTGNVTVGSGGAGAQASDHQSRAGSTGNFSRFQPSGSYNTNTSSGQITANGGGGASGTGTGSGGGAEAQGGIGFNGHQGQQAHGTSGQSGTGEAGRGGISAHGDAQHGRGANGNTSPSATNGQSGNGGFVYIFEYIGS